MTEKILSLRKSRKILEWSYGWYKKQGNKLTDAQLSAFESDLEACDAAYLQGDKEKASESAKRLEDFTNAHFKKTPWQYVSELFIALVFALAIATVVRQMWFEPYEIPTGSMRPTFKEQDHLTVSKAQFGINIPLRTGHFYFDPHLVQRTGIVIWSGDGVALRDTDSTYFGLFPYKKRYIKRLMGKPGDILYFYGGKIYGIDDKGNFIEELVNSPWLEKLEYIPFLTFQGDLTVPSRGIIQFEQMHQAIGRLTLNKKGDWIGEVYDGSNWVTDQPSLQSKPHDKIKTYTDFWGLRNFAMARLLTKSELNLYPELDTSGLKEGVLYLELIHNPSLTYPKPLLYREGSSVSLLLKPRSSIIPLQEHHLKAIMDNMYTARFEIVAGRAKRYSASESYTTSSSPYFPGIPDGTYEFYYGKAYKIGWGGIATLLPNDHPLYSLAPEHVQKLYNLGIDISMYYEPSQANQYFFPHRYAYFRDGDFYLLGGAILKKEDPTLKDFLEREQKKEQQSTENKPYTAFKDYGPPIKEGKIDGEFLKKFGLHIPPKHYLVLGDNHAMSADSRIFGFLPQANLQGVPELIIWPPGPRLGHPPQKPYPIFTLPRLIIWGTALIVAIIWYLIYRHRMKTPVFQRRARAVNKI